MMQKYQVVGVEEERAILGELVDVVVRELDGNLWSFLRWRDSEVTVSDSQKTFPGKTLEDAEDYLRENHCLVYWEKYTPL